MHGIGLEQECIRGALKSKTVLLVTHQVEFLHGADQILVSRRILYRECDVKEMSSAHCLRSRTLHFQLQWQICERFEVLLLQLIFGSGQFSWVRISPSWFTLTGEQVYFQHKYISKSRPNGEISCLLQVMRDGNIVQAGKYDALLEEGGDFESLVLAHDESLGKVGSDKDREESSNGSPDVEESSSELGRSLSGPRENVQPDQRDSGLSTTKEPKKGPSTLVKEEQRGVGRVSWKYYGEYCTKAFGWKAAIMLLIMQTFWQGLLVCGDYWLAYETSEENRSQFQKGRFFWVYASFATGSWLMVLTRTALGTTLGLKTAQAFYLEMLHSIFRAPMSFFDTTPTGRILSRVSSISLYDVLN
jgi:hypothetical protein